MVTLKDISIPSDITAPFDQLNGNSSPLIYKVFLMMKDLKATKRMVADEPTMSIDEKNYSLSQLENLAKALDIDDRKAYLLSFDLFYPMYDTVRIEDKSKGEGFQSVKANQNPKFLSTEEQFQKFELLYDKYSKIDSVNSKASPLHDDEEFISGIVRNTAYGRRSDNVFVELRESNKTNPAALKEISEYEKIVNELLPPVSNEKGKELKSR